MAGQTVCCELDRQICVSCPFLPCWCLRLLLYLLSHAWAFWLAPGCSDVHRCYSGPLGTMEQGNSACMAMKVHTNKRIGCFGLENKRGRRGLQDDAGGKKPLGVYPRCQHLGVAAVWGQQDHPGWRGGCGLSCRKPQEQFGFASRSSGMVLVPGSGFWSDVVLKSLSGI